MGAVVEQIQQTYDLQVNGYYSRLHMLEDFLTQEGVRSIELDRNKKFFEAWQKESESTLIFLQENGKAITTDGTKLRVDMPSKLLLDLRNGYNIGKLVSLDYNQKKKMVIWLQFHVRNIRLRGKLIRQLEPCMIIQN